MKIFFFFVLTLFSTVGYPKSDIEIYDLTTEYKTNPIGIGELQPRLSWKIKSEARNVRQLSYQIIAARSEEDLKRKKNLLWDSGVIKSSQSIHITYSGTSLKSRGRVYWQAIIETNAGKAKSEIAFFELGLLSESEWKADWIEADFPHNEMTDPLPYLRKEFKLEKPIKQARLYASAIGVYSVQINGQLVGNEYLTPYWTSYHNRIQYQVYDITQMLDEGENIIGMLLGNGWSRFFRSVRTRRSSENYFNFLAGIAQLEITHEDGTQSIITTNDSWKSNSGALLYSTIYSGEMYDARKEMPGWDQPGYDDSDWKEVKVIDHPKRVLVSTDGEPVVTHEEISPISIFKTPKGEVIADMGQNMVGWIRLKVKGSRGDTVTLNHAEVLDRNGNFYTENLRAAKQEMKYILKDDNEQIFQPMFSFQGFRYVKIEGLEEPPTEEQLTGVVVHSRIPETGGFTCSDSLINQLQQNIVWGQKGNFVDIPTDCPQRDERLGWTGDAQVFASTACFNRYSPAFFTKWLKDLAIEQDSSGMVKYCVPNVHGQSGGASGWADAALIVPWNLYQYYGDERILERQYASMKAWVEFMHKEAKNGLWYPEHRQFGDWLSFSSDRPDYPGAYTEKVLISNAFYAHSTKLLSKSAEVLKYEEDAKKYNQLFQNIREKYIREFITPAGRIASETQTAYVLSLYFNLVPEDLISVAAQHLADDVNNFGHITTGFLGTNLICHVLSENGYTDEAYMLLNRKDYPSWLYPVTMGATTIWERWDGIKPDGNFQDPAMNSFNHYAYGAIGDWLYKTVAGIDQLSSGYQNIVIKPKPGGGLTHTKAWHESMYGRIESRWEIKGNEMQLQVKIPPNTTAEVYIHAETDVISESDEKLNDLNYIQNINEVDDYTVVRVGSGTYNFSYPFR